MNLLESLINILAPLECLACGAEGKLLCSACSENLPAAASQCYSCRRPTPNYEVCSICSRHSSLNSVHVATTYQNVGKDVLWQLKLAGVRSSAQLIADRIANVLPKQSNTLIVAVPTATSRARQRGYDQANLIARELSRITMMPFRNHLARSGQMHQHGLSRTKRLQQLGHAYRVLRPTHIRGKHILLVDDVITTGATLESAARVLVDAGAAEVSAAVFAQPPIKKDHIIIDV